eukprot:668082-Amphidinium_carterae.1
MPVGKEIGPGTVVAKRVAPSAVDIESISKAQHARSWQEKCVTLLHNRSLVEILDPSKTQLVITTSLLLGLSCYNCCILSLGSRLM